MAAIDRAPVFWLERLLQPFPGVLCAPFYHFGVLIGTPEKENEHAVFDFGPDGLHGAGERRTLGQFQLCPEFKPFSTVTEIGEFPYTPGPYGLGTAIALVSIKARDVARNYGTYGLGNRNCLSFARALVKELGITKLPSPGCEFNISRITSKTDELPEVDDIIPPSKQDDRPEVDDAIPPSKQGGLLGCDNCPPNLDGLPEMFDAMCPSQRTRDVMSQEFARLTETCDLDAVDLLGFHEFECAPVSGTVQKIQAVSRLSLRFPGFLDNLPDENDAAVENILKILCSILNAPALRAWLPAVSEADLRVWISDLHQKMNPTGTKPTFTELLNVLPEFPSFLVGELKKSIQRSVFSQARRLFERAKLEPEYTTFFEAVMVILFEPQGKVARPKFSDFLALLKLYPKLALFAKCVILQALISRVSNQSNIFWFYLKDPAALASNELKSCVNSLNKVCYNPINGEWDFTSYLQTPHPDQHESITQILDFNLKRYLKELNNAKQYLLTKCSVINSFLDLIATLDWIVNIGLFIPAWRVWNLAGPKEGLRQERLRLLATSWATLALFLTPLRLGGRMVPGVRLDVNFVEGIIRELSLDNVDISEFYIAIA